MERIFGQNSFRIDSDQITAYVSEHGGMLGPVEFHFDDRTIAPLSVAPWFEDELSEIEPPLLRGLRGDFFCMPFGFHEDTYVGENHPMHGETANGTWTLDRESPGRLDLLFECQIRKAKVFKSIRLAGTCVYQKHTILGLDGPMNFGHHVMVKCQSRGLIGTHPFDFGQVYPEEFEDAERGGYSSLKPASIFSSIQEIPLKNGSVTDGSFFPNRGGYDDLIQIGAVPSRRLGWSTITFPEESFVYFQFKNLQQLPSTIFWFSNGGRHYSPWNGRHRGVIGMEEVRSFFHLGLKGSMMPNEFQAHGIPTAFDFQNGAPLEICTILGVAKIPTGFDRVSHVIESGRGFILISESGHRVDIECDPLFLLI